MATDYHSIMRKTICSVAEKVLKAKTCIILHYIGFFAIYENETIDSFFQPFAAKDASRSQKLGQAFNLLMRAAFIRLKENSILLTCTWYLPKYRDSMKIKLIFFFFSGVWYG